MSDSKIETNRKRIPPNAGKGRPKGAPNKATKAFRETVQALLDKNSENVAEWLQTVAEGKTATMVTKDGKEYEEYVVSPDPGKALDLLAKLAEYAAPKLSRTEVTGQDGGPVKTVIQWQSE